MRRHTTRLILGLLLMVASNTVSVTANNGGPGPLRRMVHWQFDGGEPPYCLPKPCLADLRPQT